MPEKRKTKLRSDQWFNNPKNPDMTALYLEKYMNYGLKRKDLQSGKPIIGIAQSGSDLSPCNRHFLSLIQNSATTYGPRLLFLALGNTLTTVPIFKLLSTPSCLIVEKSYAPNGKGSTQTSLCLIFMDVVLAIGDMWAISPVILILAKIL